MAEAINHENPRNRRGGLSPREAADDLGVCVSTVYVLMGTRRSPSNSSWGTGPTSATPTRWTSWSPA